MKNISKAKVISVSEYTRKKDGSKCWMVNLLNEDGILRAFRPYEEQPKQGDEYIVQAIYDAFNFTYRITFSK